jgi:tetratricopeptide (TPR) repeat protein
MFKKSVLKYTCMAVAIFAFQGAASAQFAPVGGVVEMVKADGTREPVANALIEVFRVDMKTGFPAAKTNKNGEFNFAGLPLGVTFVFGVSAPGASPTIFPNVRAGQQKLLITMTPGDGGKLTEDEVRAGVNKPASSSGTGELTAEQKKQQAEFEKKNNEIKEKNKKIEEGDALAKRSFEEGNAALKAENFELALAKFDTGVSAVPDFVGSTPILLSGKMLALKNLGFNRYREGAASSDPSVRIGKYQEANKYYEDALAAFQQALDVIKNAEAAADTAEQKRRDQMRAELYASATEIHRLKAVGQVDTSKTADALAVITEYMNLEADPAKKLAARLTLGDIMRAAGDFEKAVAAYKAVLEVKPDHADAMGSLGLSLFAQGVAMVPEDKALQQEGLNYMQKYTEIAPIAPTDSQAVRELKQSVKETVDYLKNQQKMTPQKVATPPKRRP